MKTIPLVLMASREEVWDEEDGGPGTVFRLKVGDFLVAEHHEDCTDLDDDDLQQWVADTLKKAIG